MDACARRGEEKNPKWRETERRGEERKGKKEVGDDSEMVEGRRGEERKGDKTDKR